jgi:glycosyltransferase involved in cell wall biosynthesis
MSSCSNIVKVVFSVTNCICYDQRVLKIAETVKQLGTNITIIGRKTADCTDNTSVPFRTIRFNMIFRKGFLFYKFFNLRLFFHLLFNNYDLLVSNDLDTLLPNYLVSKIKRLPLIYDSHEFFTGVPELNNRLFVRWVWKSIESLIFPGLKNVMTVSEPIALLYEKMYNVKPVVIRNAGRRSDHITAFSREELNISPDLLIIILQGGGINIDKGGEELIEALSFTENVSLLVIGGGDVLEGLKEMARKLNIEQKVRFIPKLPWEELMKYTKAADIGMCLEKDTNINYRYSLSNKLFDYISAGIPVISGNLPEVARIITDNSCGIIIPEVTPQEINEAINKIYENRLLLSELKINAVAASEILNWDNESVKVKVFYKNVLGNM